MTVADDDTLIRVEGVSKKFCRDLKRSLWYGVQDAAGDYAGLASGYAKLRHDEFWAVEDVSFELKRGECLGLVGRNGAGKTTLLKMLNGLIKPDKGRIEMRGRVGALIALGAGFNPILTGRENIYVNGAVLGLSKKEIDAKLDDIIAFAEIGEFIDMPVRSYSSGMQVRLGFSVATAMEPDVLLLDEVLAVGDAPFRARCYDRMNELRQRCAVIFVSHNNAQVARLCNQCLLLARGKTVIQADTPTALERYEVMALDEAAGRANRYGNGRARITRFELQDETGRPVERVDYGQALCIAMEVEADEDVGDVVVDIGFRKSSSDLVAECNNYVDRTPLRLVKGPGNRFSARIEAIPLNPGAYNVSAFLLSGDMLTHYDWAENIGQLTVGGRPAIAGVQIPAIWEQQ